MPPSIEDIPPDKKALFVRASAAIGLVGLGAILGLCSAPETPRESLAKMEKLRAQLREAKDEIEQIKRSHQYERNDSSAVPNKLSPKDRKRHELFGKIHSYTLRRAGAQPAAELMGWFIKRWNELLDNPRPDDRVGRRAETLSLLVGGMAQNLAPEHYVPWQAEFFINGDWLGELHFDLDGDALPSKRRSRNTKDSFRDVSVCHIAMALNQSFTDAQVLVTPDMRCDRADAKLSLFLQGKTLNDALDQFVRELKGEGFKVLERTEKRVRVKKGKRSKDSVRLVLVSNRRRR